MLVDYMERGIRLREQTHRTLDHIVINAGYWRRILRDQGVALNELAVPAVCGALVALAEIGRMVVGINRASKDEQPKEKCAKCEARLVELSNRCE
jgi:hypothetical protein